MSEKSSPSKEPNINVTIPSSPRLPLLIISLGMASVLLPVRLWPSLLIIIFGLFLLIQSFTLRLEFTKEDLVVRQLGNELRRFPFKNWIAWRLLLPGLPGLLYFREKASPHLLPILFDTEVLKEQLRLKVGHLEINE